MSSFTKPLNTRGLERHIDMTRAESRRIRMETAQRDVFEEQQNVVRTKIKGKNKSFILIKENDKGVLNFL